VRWRWALNHYQVTANFEHSVLASLTGHIQKLELQGNVSLAQLFELKLTIVTGCAVNGLCKMPMMMNDTKLPTARMILDGGGGANINDIDDDGDGADEQDYNTNQAITRPWTKYWHFMYRQDHCCNVRQYG
jgi:hypothetical protein